MRSKKLLLIATFLVIILFLVAKNMAIVLPPMSKINIARADITEIVTAIEIYKVNHGAYPSVLNEISKNIKIDDPWANKYIYKHPSHRPGYDYDIISCGKDKLLGTEDDIINGDLK